MAYFKHHSKLELEELAYSFMPNKFKLIIQPINSGLINQTFLIVPLILCEFKPFLLQRINKEVFAKPRDIISNYLFLQHQLITKQQNVNRSKATLKIPKLLINQINNKYYTELKGNFWRAFEYIPNSITYNSLPSDSSFDNLFRALANFHYSTTDIPLGKFKITLPNFHNTSFYIAEYKKALDIFIANNDQREGIPQSVNSIFSYANDNISEGLLLEEAKSKNILSFNIIHGDPKVNNFLFESTSNDVLAIIDLDTLQDGYLIYDISDCLRSSCNLLGEESKALNDIRFDLTSFKLSLSSYFNSGFNTLNKSDIYFLPYCIRVITYELGIRFLTDYLLGDNYFKTSYKQHNLTRSKVQFKLLNSIKENWNDIVDITNNLYTSRI
ncbi:MULTISPECIES: phosphotransferase enzyme family protein [Prochlorococcus]|uniref:Homoserine/choline kinase family protein n=1 Tax=Prochlorococcus marinus (strain SARG / CCMP1375 / SS120) TaxID=167539 RepID=Q7VCE2_PROMA|nr:MULTISPECIES: aminoglycoside phosphotransferase family protein [Prochlorococcus]AAP99842.1 Homoserine/choline kinase family protein [Prochlorococcus marinus subsp. marinus str. CCMP1375]KGG11811.1 hypothetical protein EV04_0836 [Prochlorococcus marinus str. LG]KGG21882.1 hypothetical protein EV08_0487 [Prochlorococcus marinus str. SS2]KGG32077.1 hypothetical protein EV10_1191 [Prochlorococcus marinus str. SS51]KGG35232.1 hypothetical protein EV11_1635 [Prochlorococcus sp. SS52]